MPEALRGACLGGRSDVHSTDESHRCTLITVNEILACYSKRSTKDSRVTEAVSNRPIRPAGWPPTQDQALQSSRRYGVLQETTPAVSSLLPPALSRVAPV